MAQAYILKNQHDRFLDKHGEWVDQAADTTLFRTSHKDEAVNVMVECSVKSPDLRIQIVPCQLNERGRLSTLTSTADTGQSIDSPAAETFAADEPANEAPQAEAAEPRTGD